MIKDIDEFLHTAFEWFHEAEEEVKSNFPKQEVVQNAPKNKKASTI